MASDETPKDTKDAKDTDAPEQASGDAAPAATAPKPPRPTFKPGAKPPSFKPKTPPPAFKPKAEAPPSELKAPPADQDETDKPQPEGVQAARDAVRAEAETPAEPSASEPETLTEPEAKAKGGLLGSLKSKKKDSDTEKATPKGATEEGKPAKAKGGAFKFGKKKKPTAEDATEAPAAAETPKSERETPVPEDAPPEDTKPETPEAKPSFLQKPAGLAVMAGGALVVGIFLGSSVFAPEPPPPTGIQRIAKNQHAPPGRVALCGAVERTEDCVFYILNSDTREREAGEFYDEVARRLNTQKHLLEGRNLDYDRTRIRPGYMAEIYVPALK